MTQVLNHIVRYISKYYNDPDMWYLKQMGDPTHSSHKGSGYCFVFTYADFVYDKNVSDISQLLSPFLKHI